MTYAVEVTAAAHENGCAGLVHGDVSDPAGRPAHQDRPARTEGDRFMGLGPERGEVVGTAVVMSGVLLDEEDAGRAEAP